MNWVESNWPPSSEIVCYTDGSKMESGSGLESTQQTRILRTGNIWSIMLIYLKQRSSLFSNVTLVSLTAPIKAICTFVHTAKPQHLLSRHHIKLGKRMQNGIQSSAAVERDRFCVGARAFGCGR